MNWDLISLLIFYGLLLVFYFTHKEKFTVQGKIFFLYKTKLGLKLMRKLARFRILKFLASIGVFIGFAGMIFIFVFLVKETLKLVFVPGTPPALAPVLPGIQIEGAPALSFWHWIIAIFLTAVVHEFGHGVASVMEKIKVKSSGFAFLGPLLAAFVEPDEKQLENARVWDQLRIFAAGPAVNIVIGVILFLGMIFVLSPAMGAVYDADGVSVSSTMEGYPMNATGIETPFTIYSINDEEVLDVLQFLNVSESLYPGDEVTLGTDKGDYSVVLVENPENASKGFFGVSGFAQETKLNNGFGWLDGYESVIEWFMLLYIWLFLINVGIGLFNLLPLGPVDGGRMFYSLVFVLFKDKEKAHKALTWISLFVLGLIVINMLPWLSDLLLWLLGLFNVS
tara:strand:+ start:1434 stop:2615 length:1182 start_codon:yes stop_codon:yes gene_type:complete